MCKAKIVKNGSKKNLFDLITFLLFQKVYKMFSKQTLSDYVGQITAHRVGFSLVFIKYQPICRVIKNSVSLVSIQYVLPVN